MRQRWRLAGGGGIRLVLRAALPTESTTDEVRQSPQSKDDDKERKAEYNFVTFSPVRRIRPRVVKRNEPRLVGPGLNRLEARTRIRNREYFDRCLNARCLSLRRCRPCNRQVVVSRYRPLLS